MRLPNTTAVTGGLEEAKMKIRVIAAAALLPLLLIVLIFLPAVFTAVLFGLMAALAAYELLWPTGLVKQPRLIAYSMAMALLVPLWCHFGMAYAWALLGILAFFAALFAEVLAAHGKLPFEKIALCLAAGLLLPFLLSSVVRILEMDDGRILVLMPFLLAFLSDSGAYFAGMFFGKHKLAPVISPKKTVEGVIGGILGAIVGMVIYCLAVSLAFQWVANYLYAVLYGIAGSLAGVFGDLCFSAVKRQTGIKDYGKLIPGHGGILDRFDSMMVVGPLTEVLLLLLPVVV